jgi:hypothetical protein
VENIFQNVWFGGKFYLPLPSFMNIVENYRYKIVDNFDEKNLDIPNIVPTFVPMLKLKTQNYALTFS